MKLKIKYKFYEEIKFINENNAINWIESLRQYKYIIVTKLGKEIARYRDKRNSPIDIYIQSRTGSEFLFYRRIEEYGYLTVDIKDFTLYPHHEYISGQYLLSAFVKRASLSYIETSSEYMIPIGSEVLPEADWERLKRYSEDIVRYKESNVSTLGIRGLVRKCVYNNPRSLVDICFFFEKMNVYYGKSYLKIDFHKPRNDIEGIPYDPNVHTYGWLEWTSIVCYIPKKEISILKLDDYIREKIKEVIYVNILDSFSKEDNYCVEIWIIMGINIFIVEAKLKELSWTKILETDM